MVQTYLMIYVESAVSVVNMVIDLTHRKKWFEVKSHPMGGWTIRCKDEPGLPNRFYEPDVHISVEEIPREEVRRHGRF